MADKASTDKHPPRPTVEDCTESDEDKGGESSTSNKPASNSHHKRVPTVHQKQPSKTQPLDDAPKPDRNREKHRSDKAHRPEESATHSKAKIDASPEPATQRPHKSRRHSQAQPPPILKASAQGERPRSPGRRPLVERPRPACDCSECVIRHSPRPGPNPVQYSSHHAYTHPIPLNHGLQPVVRQDSYMAGPMPMHPRMIPGYHGAPVPGGRPPMRPPLDPRLQVHPNMAPPSVSSRPPSLPSVRGPSSPGKVPGRAVIRQQEPPPAGRSAPMFTSSKIEISDTFSADHHPHEDEHYSTRTLPSRQLVPGGSSPESFSSASPPESPQDYDHSMRPQLMQRATTSDITRAHRSGHMRSRSDYPVEPPYGYRQGHPLEFQSDHDRGMERRPEPSWDQYSHGGYSEYEDHRNYSGGRRGSNASGMTQQTSVSDPPDHRYGLYPPSGRHDGYPPPDPYMRTQDNAVRYMDETRGYGESRVTAETLRQLPHGNGPRSDVSHRSRGSHHRSQHSASETSSRYRGADGSVKLIMPMAAAEETRIQLGGDMTDREVSFRPTDDPTKVEVTIATVGGREGKYLKSASSTSRAPTRSSGSTRRSTHRGTEGQEQVREREHGYLNRTPSSRR